MEELDYVSTSASLLSDKPAVKPQDEADTPTLERVQARLDEYRNLYNSNESLTVDESIFTVKEQLAINQRSVVIIDELRQMIETTVNEVKEKYKNE